jgi:hypothetical protein
MKRDEGFFLKVSEGLRALSLFFLVLMFAACATLNSSNRDPAAALAWTEDDNRPKTVVILPFENRTQEQDIETLFRESFYNHFSSKNFYDLELNEVDAVLETLEKSTSQKWRELSPSTLGGLFRANYIIYGEVLDFSKTFLGVYSQIALEVKLEMFEAKSGDAVWRRKVVRRSHEGGVPFSLYGIIPAALRCGFHMQKERTLDLIERVNRELAGEIPNPPATPVAPFFIEIQVASFSEMGRAERTLRDLEDKGFRPHIASVTLGGIVWHRVLLGPFYKFEDAKRAREALMWRTQFKPIYIHYAPVKEKVGVFEKSRFPQKNPPAAPV